MKLTKVFFIVLLATALLFGGQTEAGGLKHLGKRLEKLGQNILDVVKKVLPVVQQIKDLSNKNKGK